MSENITALRLRKIRGEKGIAQDVVSSACEISRVALARYENGSRFPKADIIARLAEYYGVTSDYLLGRDSDEDQPDQVSDRMKRFLHEVQDMDDSEIELVSMFLEQVKKRRE